MWIASLDVEVYNLIYNNTLSKLFFSNQYSKLTSYTDTLSLDSTETFNFYFNEYKFDSTSDFTSYIENIFKINVIEKINCILFDDNITYLAKNENEEINVLIDSTNINTPFSLKIKDRLFREDDIISLPYNIVNNDSTSTINNIETSGTHILYNNYFYHNDTNNNEINFSSFNRLVPYLNDTITSYDVYNKNYLMFYAWDNINAIKSEVYNFNNLSIWCSQIFNLDHYVLTTDVNENLKVGNIFTNKLGQNVIFKSFPFNTADQKIETVATMWNPGAIEYDIFHDKVEDKNQNGEEYFSSLFNATKSSNFIFDFDESKILTTENILIEDVETYETYNEVLYKNVTKDINNSRDCLLTTKFSPDKYYNSHKMILNFQNENWNNIINTNEIVTNLTKDFDEFTMIFTSGHILGEGFSTIIGDFWKMLNGELYVMDNKVENYHIDFTSIDSTESLLHIISHIDGTMTYESHTTSEIFCDLTATVDTTNFIDVSKIYVISNKDELNITVDSKTADKYFRLGQLAIYNHKLEDFLIDKIKNKFYFSGNEDINFLPLI